MKKLKSKLPRILLLVWIIVLSHSLSATPPVVSRIFPRSGPQKGGTRILIEGCNFDRTSIVKIGNKQCPFIKVYKSKSRKPDVILTIIPEGPPILTSYYVTVTNSKGETSPHKKESVYTYIPLVSFNANN